MNFKYVFLISLDYYIYIIYQYKEESYVYIPNAF